jgi:serum/glucocorticoid-regulated kinase 2
MALENIIVQLDNVENSTSKIGVVQYLTERTVKVGSSVTRQVRKKDTQQLYAPKEIQAVDTFPRSEESCNILFNICNPFIAVVKLVCQSTSFLYLFSTFASGGHLFYHLQKERRCDFSRSMFYAAELVCALEYLHGLGLLLWLE